MEGLYELPNYDLSNGRPTTPDPLWPRPHWGLQISYPLLSQEQVKLQTSNLATAFTGPIQIKPI